MNRVPSDGLWRVGMALSIALVLGACSREPEHAELAYTPSGAHLRWPVKEIVLTPAPERAGGEPPAMLGPALTSAASAWNHALAGCNAPRLLANRVVLDGPALGDDLVNAVIFHERKWCPITSVQREDCYPADSQAHTLLYPTLQPASPHDGELRGVDIEVNGVDFRWSQRESPNALSLQTILIHELGHVLGLDHPCGPNTAWSNKRRPLVACDPNATAQVMRGDIASVTQGEAPLPSKVEVAQVCELYR